VAKRKKKEEEPEGLVFDDTAGLGLEDGGGLFAEDQPVDPIGEIDYPGTPDGDLKATLDAVGEAFKARAKAERERFQAATDSEYWFAIAFESRAQKEAFLKFMKWARFGDKHIDGVALAEHMGVTLPAASVPYLAAKSDRKLDEISLPLEGDGNG
jgi:hypothetical protein